jgi:hypothetical protein
VVKFLHALPFHAFNVGTWPRSVASASASYSIFWLTLFMVTLVAVCQYRRACMCGRRSTPRPDPPLGWKTATLMGFAMLTAAVALSPSAAAHVYDGAGTAGGVRHNEP